MRRPFLGFMSVLACVALISACDLVDQKDTGDYAISLPARLPTYVNGHYIEYYFALYQAGGIPVNKNGYLKFAWSTPSAPIPLEFGQGDLTTYVLSTFSRSLLRFTQIENLGEGDKTTVQYTSQDSYGSFYAHGFEGTGATESIAAANAYWFSPDGTLATPAIPLPQQQLWSPFNDGQGNSFLGTDFVAGGLITDQHIVGHCTTTCIDRVTLSWQEYKYEPGIESIETPLGTFEAYRLRYRATLTVGIAFLEAPYFDIRFSCWAPGAVGTYTIQGSMLIYPPIGPVSIDNRCTPNTGTGTYYVAEISDTNLSF